MARLPTKFDLSQPASLRSGTMISSADTSAIGRGMTSLGGSIMEAGQNVDKALEGMRQRQNAVDLARANAFQDQSNVDLLNRFDKDPEFGTFGERAPKDADDIVATGAAMIRDPKARELWELQAKTVAKRTADAVVDKGFLLQQQADVVSLDEALETQRRLYIDPNTPEEAKTKARASIEGAITVGLGTGLLTPAAADARRKSYLDDADFERAKLDTSIAGGTDAANVVRGFEGFRTEPYWDVNAYRIGYGSDTVTQADGTVVRVKPGMVINREDAERDLARRLVDFQDGIRTDIGAARFDAMPAAAQAALTSTAYNYGSLPKTVVAAARSGDLEKIAQAVEDLQGHNDGVNRDRRLKEAALIRGQGEPEYFASLPADRRQEVYDLRNEERRRADTAAAAEAKTLYTEHDNQVALGILTGNIVSEQQILSDPLLDDGDKAKHLRSFRSEQDATADARALLSSIGDGSVDINPFDSGDRSKANKAYDLMVSSVAPEQKAAATAAFVQETGFIPNPVVADVRQNLASNDPVAVGQGLQQAAALLDTAPQALAAVENGKELQDAAATYSELVNGRGLSIDDAAAQVIAMRDPANRLKAETLDAGWKQAVKDKVFSTNDVVAAFDGGWFGGGQPSAGITPAQQAGLTADYFSAAERAFRGAANGDPGIAKQIAIAEIKRTYGVSETSGTRALMKYPPEQFYPPINQGFGYIRDAALVDAKSIDPTAQNVMLVSAPTTAEDIRAGVPPRYDLFYQRPDGVWDMAPGMFAITPEDYKTLTAQATEARAAEFQQRRTKAEQDAAIVDEEAEFLRKQSETFGMMGGAP